MKILFKKEGFRFILKKVGEINKRDKEDIYHLNIKTYPDFKEYYNKNRYFSTVKPKMIFMIKRGALLVGDGKFLWRRVFVNNKRIKLAVFGLLIETKYQNKGLGTQLIKLQIKEAGKKEADIVYGSTKNPVAERMLKKLGFRKIIAPVFYKEVLTKKIKREKNSVYLLEFKKGLIEEINRLNKFYIGNGPV